jgi:hypothetical protein
MGRTIPSFRIAAEMERAKWRDFRSLLNLKDRKMFDQMFSYVRFYNSACMMQASPVVIHPVIMSILFHHYKQLMKLTDKKNKGELRVPYRPEPQGKSTLDIYCLSAGERKREG